MVALLSLIQNKDTIESTLPYLSPSHITSDASSGKVYVSLATAAKIAVLNMSSNKFEKYINLPFDPGGIAVWKKSGILLVADKSPEGHVHQISLKTGEIKKSIRVGHTPDAIIITPDERQLFVANRFSNTVSVIDLDNNIVTKTIPVDRDPVALAISKQGNTIAVANQIPNAASTDSFISAKVTLINREILDRTASISLANGSQSIRGITFSDNGDYLYASHILSRHSLPTTQIEHGWINSNALSIINVHEKKYYTSVLLDNFNRGAANPVGLALSGDGSKLFVALSGVNEIAILDLPKLHSKLSLHENNIDQIPNDLRFLNGIRRRFPTSGKSPRHLRVSGKSLLVSSYFSSEIEVFDLSSELETSKAISLGNEPTMNSARTGEMLFGQADLCFQDWQSCISCHPDGRVDGLNWDLLNDGAGNPKNNKSMLYAHYTPPAMITGIRESAKVAVRAGMKYILFTEPQKPKAEDIDTYLMSLEQVPSPHLKNGKLSKNAKKGKSLFKKADCLRCHSGKYHTDGHKYDVETGVGQHKSTLFDVPTLSEVWRTAPYLYDGRAITMKEVFTRYNPDDKHGITSTLSENELDFLVEYVLSL